ncbi:MAG: hypothetical protein K8963_04415, partial [Proteobacteria bacterium]|nr:hypothetical protein [Pseudomonadota bacterium]
TFFILNPFPMPRPKRTSPLWKRVVALSGRLACPDERFKDWADSVGVSWGPIDPERKQKMIFELDAVVAHLYGLSKKQLTHIFETFHEKKVDRERLEGVLGYYVQWEKKTAS